MVVIPWKGGSSFDLPKIPRKKNLETLDYAKKIIWKHQKLVVFTSWELLNRIIIPFIPCRDHTGSIYIPIYIVFLWKKYEDVAKYIIHGYDRYVRNLFFRAFFRKASEKSTPFSNQLNSFPPEIHLKRPWAPPLNSEMILIPSVWNEENTGPTFHGKFVRKSIDSTVTFHGILLMVQKSCTTWDV